MRLWTLPLRFAFFPFAFMFGCAILLGVPAIAEYAGADELLEDRQIRRRLFPVREWFVVAARSTFPELR